LKGGDNMAKLKKNYIVQKKNVLNELRPNNMMLQELRFFSIYLSKINETDKNTRIVRFSIENFKAIMELNSRIKIDYMKKVTNSLLCRVVNVPNESGGYTGFQLFKECRVDKDEDGEWYVEIDAHDKALPLMFEFKDRYFTYQLWNILRLKSSNQLRMYEILKQYQTIGYRILTIDELKSLIGIGKDEYLQWNNFKIRVLDVCQKALAEHTDIKFTYEPHGKKGKGGKILTLKFTIEENKGYTDKLTLNTYIKENKLKGDILAECEYFEEELNKKDEIYTPIYKERIEFFMEACNGEFSFDEMKIFHDKMHSRLLYEYFGDQIYCYNYIKYRYNYMNLQSKKRKIENRFGYMKKIISEDI
jgi:plasmid replication initiation protein